MRGTRLDNGTVEGWTTDDIIDIITCTSPLITRTTYLIEYIMAIYLVLFSQIDEIMMLYLLARPPRGGIARLGRNRGPLPALDSPKVTFALCEV